MLNLNERQIESNITYLQGIYAYLFVIIYIIQLNDVIPRRDWPERFSFLRAVWAQLAGLDYTCPLVTDFWLQGFQGRELHDL